MSCKLYCVAIVFSIKRGYELVFTMIFNLLPIIPLDGSKILFEIYAYFLPFKKVIKYHYLTSFLFILIYLFLNYKYNFNNSYAKYSDINIISIKLS